jgi:predicted unusual protein kinase regulating ubiquinone biosynthesis (AarF/ABC1/UbiB family)
MTPLSPILPNPPSSLSPRELYGNLPNVSAPAVIESLSTSRVMTMDWVYGSRLTDAAEGRAAWPIGPDGTEVPPAALVDTLVQCSLRQVRLNPNPG